MSVAQILIRKRSLKNYLLVPLLFTNLMGCEDNASDGNEQTPVAVDFSISRLAHLPGRLTFNNHTIDIADGYQFQRKSITVKNGDDTLYSHTITDNNDSFPHLDITTGGVYEAELTVSVSPVNELESYARHNAGITGNEDPSLTASEAAELLAALGGNASTNSDSGSDDIANCFEHCLFDVGGDCDAETIVMDCKLSTACNSIDLVDAQTYLKDNLQTWLHEASSGVGACSPTEYDVSIDEGTLLGLAVYGGGGGHGDNGSSVGGKGGASGKALTITTFGELQSETTALYYGIASKGNTTQYGGDGGASSFFSTVPFDDTLFFPEDLSTIPAIAGGGGGGEDGGSGLGETGDNGYRGGKAFSDSIGDPDYDMGGKLFELYYETESISVFASDDSAYEAAHDKISELIGDNFSAFTSDIGGKGGANGQNGANAGWLNDITGSIADAIGDSGQGDTGEDGNDDDAFGSDYADGGGGGGFRGGTGNDSGDGGGSLAKASTQLPSDTLIESFKAEIFDDDYDYYEADGEAHLLWILRDDG